MLIVLPGEVPFGFFTFLEGFYDGLDFGDLLVLEDEGGEGFARGDVEEEAGGRGRGGG